MIRSTRLSKTSVPASIKSIRPMLGYRDVEALGPWYHDYKQMDFSADSMAPVLDCG
jgi:hypothetical protein